MLKFNSDGKFKIMQISDAQDLPLVRKSLVRMINRACDVLQPDLVLFTGDNIPVSYTHLTLPTNSLV